MTIPSTSSTPSLWLRATPAVFVLIWSTGFIVAKFGLPYASPLWFLVLRFVGVLAVLGVALPFVTVQWPTRRDVGHLAFAGVLLQLGYLGGVWVAISLGMPAGLAALIVGLQPILTAFAAPAVGERVIARQWIGFALGFCGVVLVVADKIALIALPLASVLLAVMALFSITIGTLYQKRYCPSFDLRAGTMIQFVSSLAIALPLALVFETWDVRFTPQFVGALSWAVFVLSIGGMALLFPIIRRGEATRVTSLFYLTPPVTALMAWIAFNERFSPRAMLGMACTVAGVALVVMRRHQSPEPQRLPESR
jgi:drug/metabolite transporter (DMT)-like permease